MKDIPIWEVTRQCSGRHEIVDRERRMRTDENCITGVCGFVGSERDGARGASARKIGTRSKLSRRARNHRPRMKAV